MNMKQVLLLFITMHTAQLAAQSTSAVRMDSSLSLLTSISGNMSPKSVVHSGNGQFFSQNMMYRHTVTVHDREHNLIATISDAITPSDYELNGNHKLRGAPVECAFSHKGRYAWVSNYNMTGKGFTNPGCDGCNGEKYDSSFVYKIDLLNYQITNAIPVGSVPKFVAIAPNDSLLLVSNWSSGNVSLVDLISEKEIKQIRVGAHPRGIAISPDSKTAYVAIMGSSKIVEINLNDYSKTVLSDIGKGPRHLCIGPQGKYLYVSINGEGKIGKYDLTNKSLVKLKTGRMPRTMALSANGEYLYVVNYGDHKLTKIRTADFTIRDIIKTGSKPIGVTIDNELGRVWVSCYSGKINVFQDSILAQSKSLTDKTLLALGNPIDFIPEITTKADTQSIETKVDEPILKPTVLVAESVKPLSNSSNAIQYHIIAGSFSNIDNAKREKSRWNKKDYEASIIHSEKGHNLISIASGYNKNELKVKLASYKRKSDVSFWIYSR